MSIAPPPSALPFWISLGLFPVVGFTTVAGGWWILSIPAATWGLFALLDAALGRNLANPDPDTPEATLTLHTAILRLWPGLQLAMLVLLLIYVPSAAHLSAIEKIGLFFGTGVVTGTVGITYAHELMHRPGRFDRWLADVLLAMVCYGHFRTEHLLVHHVHVGTPRDAVTARYNEGFHRFFARVLPGSYLSAWRTERARLTIRGLPVWDRTNPFWRYHGMQAGLALMAILLGGWVGLALWLYQAFIAIWQLELVNYVEHYGLARRPLGDGKYEPARAHHSWNATHRASNWLLINLQRHSDHHIRPDRPYPLLQSAEDAAPQLPHGYAVMTALAMIPPLWRRRMNPEVRAWRATYYPDVADWRAEARAAT